MIDQLGDIKFYKELHENEVKRKIEINGLVKFPTTLLMVIIGAGFYLYKPLFEVSPNSIHDCVWCTLILFAIVFTTFLSIATFFLIRVFHNLFRKYEYLPTPFVLRDRHIEIYEHYVSYFTAQNANNIKSQSIKFSKKEFEKELFDHYIECSSNNQRVNDKRIKDFYRSRHYLMFALVVLAISSVILILNQ